jgi:periplasmic divalent cation tolerance protein
MTAEIEAIAVLCTCPDEATAGRIATDLVAERLAACVNQVQGVRSVYRWEGRVVEDAEVLLVIKTTAARFPALEAAIRERHPHQVPEIVALPISKSSRAYMQWLIEAAGE